MNGDQNNTFNSDRLMDVIDAMDEANKNNAKRVAENGEARDLRKEQDRIGVDPHVLEVLDKYLANEFYVFDNASYVDRSAA